MLNRLRKGKCTDGDIEMLKGRIIGQDVASNSIVDTPIITPGNQLVMAVNKRFIDAYTNHTVVYVSKAMDYIGKKKYGKAVPKKVANKIKNWPNTFTGGLPRVLQMYIGMPVTVTRNVAVELGITNGTVGTIRSIRLKNGQVISEETGFHNLEHPPECIIVELKDVNIEPLNGLPPNHVPIYAATDSFKVRIRGKKTPVSVNRNHFPIVPLFSCTAHKSQGQTLHKAIVDLVPNYKAKKVEVHFAYVPLSRVRRLEDLTILRPFDSSVLKPKVNEDCAAMMEYFEAMDVCKDL